MAYVLGFFYADGCMIDAVSSRTRYIAFSSVDREVLERIKTAMGSEHSLYARPGQLRTYRNGFYMSRDSFVLRIGCRKMFNDLLHFGVTPEKSKVVNLPKIPKRYLSHFLRGYFDGDGCVYLEKTKGVIKPVVVKRLSIIFTSGSSVFLKELGMALENQLDIEYRKLYDSQHAFQLRYFTNDAIKIFKFIYKSCPPELYLKRKFDIFNNYFRLSPRKIDDKITPILESLS